MPNQIQPEAVKPGVQDDELDLVQGFLFLWKYRYWIGLQVFLVTLLGVIYAFLATPVFYSQSVITLKERDKGSDASSVLSQLGGMGGIVASQLGIGNTSLDRIEIVLKGYELAQAVIKKNNLLPVLFRSQWNAKDGKWKCRDSIDIPTIRNGVIALQSNLNVIVDPKKKIIKVGMFFDDPLYSSRIVDFYLDELNEKIRDDVKADAEQNRVFLEGQLSYTSDPVLREKLQNMIGFEIEKAMLVSSKSFEVLEKPLTPIQKLKPRKALIIILAFVIGIVTAIISVVVWQMAANMKRRIKQLENQQTA